MTNIAPAILSRQIPESWGSAVLEGPESLQFLGCRGPVKTGRQPARTSEPRDVGTARTPGLRDLEFRGWTWKLERETGFEPATSTLARSHSTTELFPPRGQPIEFTQ